MTFSGSGALNVDAPIEIEYGKEYTLEWWMKLEVGQGGVVLSKRVGGSGYLFYVERNNNGYEFRYQLWSATIGYTAHVVVFPVQADGWLHGAFSKTDVEIVPCLSGKRGAAIYRSDYPTLNAGPCQIGSDSGSGGGAFTGLINHIRFTDVGRYAENFEPDQEYPLTEGDPHWDKVVLLLGFDMGFRDESPLKAGLNVSGVTRVSNPGKFGEATGMFINDRYVDTLTSTDYAFRKKDYTMEGWWAGGPDSNDKLLMETRGAGQEGIGVYRSVPATAANHLSAYDNSSGVITPPSTVQFEDYPIWNHWAVCRADGFLYGWVNGKFAWSAPDTRDYAEAARIRVGLNYLGNQSASAYFDEQRVTIGVARYLKPFRVPAKAFPRHGVALPTGPIDAHWPYVSLLLDSEGGAGSPVFFDRSILKQPIVVGGNAQVTIDNTVSGKGALLLDGSDFLEVGNVGDYNLTADDKTVECFIRSQQA
jgi:hypothetical protein